MEGSAYAEGTIAFYERLKATHPNTGLCLQSYLHRTADDIQRLLPLSPQIRLVKGAYAESPTIASSRAARSMPTTSQSRTRCSTPCTPGRRCGSGSAPTTSP